MKLVCKLMLAAAFTTLGFGSASPRASTQRSDNDSVIVPPDSGSSAYLNARAAVPSAVLGRPVSSLPANVVAFRTRLDRCDHFRGEEAYDAKRRAELERLLNRTCTGTDAELKKLRRRYVGNAAVIAALAHYEADVE